jgi:hypothetical protein
LGGGSLGEAVASALDHTYNDPSEDLDAPSRKTKKGE